MPTSTPFPQLAELNALTNAQQAVATFTANHDFSLGEIVSFRVTRNFGMHQINQKRGLIVAVTADTITVDIDSSTWDAFDFSALDTAGTTPPTVVPCCSGVVPGSMPPRINIVDNFDTRRG